MVQGKLVIREDIELLVMFRSMLYF